MKEKIVKLYEFEELPEDIQEKVLEKNRYINVDDSFWYDYDGKTGFSSKELARMKVSVKDCPAELLTWKNMYFDLDRSWYIQFTDCSFADSEIARKFLRVPADIWNRVYWSFENRNYGGSCHGTTKLVYEWEGDNELTKRQEEILDRAVEIFSDKMEEVLKGLRDSYEYLVTDEAVKETILCNEYTFTIDGRMEHL